MMKVEIWSDVLCPFCYIGKRRFEAALAQFADREKVEVVWRNFELDPTSKKRTGVSIHEVLAEKYGKTVEWARQMNANVAAQAAEVGLSFDFEKVVPNNSFDAHRLIQLARSLGRQDQMEERLFSAYFSEGLDIGDRAVLKKLAADAGLDASAVEQCLSSDQFSDEVRDDELEAAELGIRGVPAFVINRKFLVSGAQPTETFLQALQTAAREP